MLVLDNVEVVYLNVVRLLQGVSLRVDDGKIIALLGANGAGKSITLKAISGLIHSELGNVHLSGSIEFDGQRIDKKATEEIVIMGIVQVMEGHKVLDELTVNENLLIGAHMCSRKSEIRKRLEFVYREYFPELKELRQKRAGYLSGGEQQILVIARALMAQPRMILLDEISFGLAPLLISRIFEIVKRINVERKTSILLAEQNIKAALSIADFAYLMENGKVALEGSAKELKEHTRLRQFYLGLSKPDQWKRARVS
jgi:branched-chain amino acid transport system ATP-binding protein